MSPASRISTQALLLLAGAYCALAVPNPSMETKNLHLLEDHGLPLEKRANSSLAGYLGAFFLGDVPSVYFYLSQGNDAISFSPLNGGKPVLVPTLGTQGVRDPAIVPGGGDEEGKKWYIVGTDLDIVKTTWAASQRTGSRGILVWESTNLVDWTGERLVTVEDETAGMVWAPEAIWDPKKGQYLTYWASKFYDRSDTAHTGAPTNTKIRYAYTSDFKTFTAPKTYIDQAPTDIIDLTFLPYPGAPDTFLRFLKDETRTLVYVEYTTTGLFGTWTRPGGADAYIRAGVEGPAAYWDNAVEGQVHLLVDDYGGVGYIPMATSNPQSNDGWVDSPTRNFPGGLRHGAVLPVEQTSMDALAAAWA